MLPWLDKALSPMHKTSKRKNSNMTKQEDAVLTQNDSLKIRVSLLYPPPKLVRGLAG